MTHKLLNRLQEKIPERRLITDTPRLLAYGTDGGFYRLIPKLGVRARTEAEIQAVISNCHELAIPLTFMGAGTSLSGQTISDSVLVMLEHGFSQCKIMDKGEVISLGAMVTGAEANRALAGYKRKVGPDPASIKSATIAGIVANNSSGMTCGTELNAFETIDGMRIILADGTILDTRDEKSRDQFLSTHRKMANKLLGLARKVQDSPEIREKIRYKYQIKNTTGYGVNALLHYNNPIDIIEHLMVGSEGTLAFISEVTLKTVAAHPHKATALIPFYNLQDACGAIPILKQCGAAAVELMDRRTIHALEQLPGIPPYFRELGKDAALLLVEVQAKGHRHLQEITSAICSGFEKIETAKPVTFCFEEEECRRLWEIREGFDPLIFAKAQPGTLMVTEDVAVPIEKIGPCVKELHLMFDKYHYTDAVVFGHVLAGNLHFNLIVDFNSSDEVQRYKEFMDEMTDLIVGTYDGSLKAEHGTGRNMAPYVRKEWGDDIYDIMREIKRIFDPKNIFNPGVILNDDPDALIKDLKSYPLVHSSVDKCIECGFCERNCVSHGLTLSPRQRIAYLRYLAGLKASGVDKKLLRQFERSKKYLVLDTCAADGLCALACPTGINTGNYVKSLRNESISSFGNTVGLAISDHMKQATAMGRLALGLYHFFGKPLKGVLGKKTGGTPKKTTGMPIPRLFLHMPARQNERNFQKTFSHPGTKGEIVFFPSCVNRTMGQDAQTPDQQSLFSVIQTLCYRAGYGVHIPENTDALCCGLAFSSKGQFEASRKCKKTLEEALLDVSENGRLPIVCEMSPCILHMQETLCKDLRLIEPIEFTLTFLAPYLQFKRLEESIGIHPVCSAKKMGLEQDLLKLGNMCATEVVSTQTNCCGFSGDKGFFIPQLNRHGLRNVSQQLPSRVKRGFSTSRTCEIGLAEEAGIPFSSVLFLVEECTR